MNQRVVVDSDDDEELSLENETTPEETGDAPEDLDAQSRRSLSPDELGPQRGTGSTEELLREAQGPLLVKSPSPASRKRKRDSSAARKDNKYNSHSQHPDSANDLWDIPSSSPPKAVAPGSRSADLKSQRKRLTSSEIRRQHQDTPTEAATSSTSNRERLIELSRTTGDSNVTLDGLTDLEDASHSKEQDEVMVAIPRRTSEKGAATSRKDTRKKTSRATHDDDADELTRSDEEAIGMPKEMYKPKASRSRGSPPPEVENLESIERKGRRAKRRKTNADPDALEQSINDGTAQLVDMGFSPSKAQSVLRQTDGDVGRATDMLVNAPVGGFDGADESDNPIPVQASPPDADQAAASHVSPDTTTVETSPQKQQCMNPSISATDAPSKAVEPKKKRGRPKKNAAPEMTSAELGQWTDSQIHAETPEKAPSPKRQKKGRGRPKKATKEVQPLSADTVEDHDAPHAEDAGAMEAPVSQKSVDSRRHATAEDEKENTCPAQADEHSNVQETDASISPKKPTEAPAVKIGTSTPASEKLSSNPLSAIARHRVGLSNRSRFPSLLTKFRKPA